MMMVMIVMMMVVVVVVGWLWRSRREKKKVGKKRKILFTESAERKRRDAAKNVIHGVIHLVRNFSTVFIYYSRFFFSFYYFSISGGTVDKCCYVFFAFGKWPVFWSVNFCFLILFGDAIWVLLLFLFLFR